jgi:signal transduction histidine kinase
MKNLAASIATVVTITVLIFLIDIATPGEVEVGMAYILPLIVASRLSRASYIYILAAVFSFPLIFGFMFSPAQVQPEIAIINRCVALLTLWLTAFLLTSQKKSEEALRDMERLKARQEAMEVLQRQKDDLYAMVTHDLKSPLTSILGYAELMTDMLSKNKECGQDIFEMAQAIKSGGDKLGNMVEDFLTSAALESGKIEIERASVDLGDVLNYAKNSFLPEAKKKNIIILTRAGNLPVAFIDRKYIDRAVTNLVQNALIYTPPGGRVELKADNDGDSIAISVRDTGPGISDEEKDKIFEGYYRSTTTRGAKGTGLGLLVVKMVAEAHGGHVEVQSEMGKGSVFTIYLPADLNTQKATDTKKI